MRLLLDTHVLLWALSDSPRLTARARDYLLDPANECWASCVSVWEIAIKTGLGKFSLGIPLTRIESAIEAAGIFALDVTMRHAVALERISTPHTDPFDRLLLAQCEVETLKLLTADKTLQKLPAALPC